MITEEQYDQIDAYLFGHMTEEERRNFEAAVQMNEELAAELTVHRLEHAGMQLTLQNELRGQLKNWQQELLEESSSEPLTPNPERGKIRKISWRILALAASVLLVLGFFGQRWASNHYGNNALMDDVENWSVNTRGSTDIRGTSINQLRIDTANQALALENYEEVIKTLKPVDTASYNVYFLRAGAYFGLKAFPQAAENLQLAFEKAVSKRAKLDVEWKLAMTYIASREDTKAKALLQKIASNPNPDYADKAEEILKKLNSPWRKISW